jgi:hypothetical protein
MTLTQDAATLAPGRSLTSRWGLGLGFLLLLTGLLLGVAWERSQDVEWLHERAQMGVKVVSIRHDGWTYGAQGSIPSWIDEEGTRHQGGWPTCLRGTGSSWLRFAATEVTVDGATTRPIIAVDCRS